jgi:hypothetical protein
LASPGDDAVGEIASDFGLGLIIFPSYCWHAGMV